MPQEPKKRHSKSVKNIRRAAIKLSAINLVVCRNCNFKTLAHMACRNCGSYAGKKVSDEAVKVTRA
ncbi:50S ribosomal protein L32 [Candidatus Daviesbacteria bacterium]|nr:50S ribosomal protein L32 [Candidatus Daviesbacteria bacterium]